ncbi:hypothetical protein [Streptomyces sp. WG5]|uniref:hypothetical protein n=1 Tax=Streptomyces sp. WG5 TaxID=3417648 RepID=UPI003CEA1EAB
MSAREELYRRVVSSFVNEEKANKLIDDLLHEAAEKLRRNGCGCRCERTNADLIDPYSS